MDYTEHSLFSRASAALSLLALLTLLALPSDARAQATDCSEFPNSTLDGFVTPNPPSNINIDETCTIKNFPASNPLNTNFSFFTQPGQNIERWLVVFDNVVHTGQMSCNAVLEHKIWFTNGSSTSIQDGCQNLLIPVEKIDKRNPAGSTTASIGVPFTYTLTIPVLFDPNGDVNSVIDWTGSVNDLHSINLTDDLNATGVDLTYVGHSVYWRDSGAPVSYTFGNSGGLLSFDISPIIPATEQIVIEITVVLEDTPVNAPGTQFVNTAKWSFGREVDGVFYEPLPGEWGISEPLTIAAPELIMTKTGPASLNRTLNLGEWGVFGLDVYNTGLSEAFDIAIRDLLPDGPNGGMCTVTPQILSAQVFAADGVTTVPGKGPLTAGVDYVANFSGAPNCELTISTLTAAAVVGPNERLVISYQTQLDPDSQNGVLLTNIAGVTQWFNGDSSNVDRVSYSRALTNGTPTTSDHEDAHTVEVGLFGWFFEKSVVNMTTGESPAVVAGPAETLRYSIRLQTTDGPLANFSFRDDLGAMNPTVVFEPGSLSLVQSTIPGGADTSNTDPTGGTNSAGIIDIRNLDLPAFSELTIQFDVRVQAAILDGAIVTNQADLVSDAGVTLAVSDDPNVNGQADSTVDGDEDPTRVWIEAVPPELLTKSNTQATATIGETFSYQLTVPSVPHSAALYDIRILDNLVASAADLEFVGVSKLSGPGNWTPQNTGSLTNVVLEDPVNGIDIPAGQQAVIEITVRLTDTSNNVAGLTFTNTASYTYNLIDGDTATMRPGEPGTTEPMTIVEPNLTLDKNGPLRTRLGMPETFTINVHNDGDSPAYAVTLIDLLPNQDDGGMCDAAPQNITAQVFEADGTTPVSAVLVEGTDFTSSFSGDPICILTLVMQSSDTTIGVDQRLIVSYESRTDAGSLENAALTNVAGATEWFSLDPSDTAGRTYARGTTDGTVDTLDHEDAHTTTVFTPVLIFEKSAINVTSSEDPATIATPGDTIQYTLRVENANDTSIDSLEIVDELDSLNTMPAFAPGTLNVISIPAGADDSNTDPSGGASGTGVLDVRGLSLVGLGDTFEIVFEVELAAVIANDTVVLNQSSANYAGNPVAVSDDPNVDGAADPNVDGDEDPTEIRIQSAPEFVIEKVSSYTTGDPTVLLAGENLRYTVTVQNIGTDNAANVELSDLVPSNTTYVPGSTTLNGVVVADAVNGLPLQDGILVNAPQDVTPGTLNAGVADNVATVVFDVVVNADVPDGTIISNQAFVTAADYGFADLPSDDPRTEIADDPTRDIVGNLPLLFAEKSAALQIDNSSDGIVDPGDVLRYTITVYNNSNTPATVVELFDNVPNDTAYLADTITVNGQALGQSDGGVFPLAARLPISSSDLSLPGAGAGTLSPGESAVVQFDMQVDAAAQRGTLIVNQATVYSAEVASLLTDGDGDPSTGPEPTVVVVGDAQVLTIAKDVAVVGGGTALPGATLEYTVTVQNIGGVPAANVVLRDDLDEINSGYLTYVPDSATMNGVANGVSVAGQVITADYFTANGTLGPGETVTLRFQAVVESTLVEGTTIVNAARVFWDDPQQQAEATVMIDVGGLPDAGMLSGNVWHDADHDNTPGSVERQLEGWSVELLLDNQFLRATQTDADGYYLFTNVVPNFATGQVYSLRFVAPGATASTALLGEADSEFTDGQQRIDNIDVTDGSNLLGLNMPVDPNGVIYDSVARTPVAGAVVTLLDARTIAPLPSSCFDDPNQQGQMTIGNGYYKFDINFSSAGCPDPGNYLIDVTVPGMAYVPGVSEMIPPTSDLSTQPFDVPACPATFNDAVTATTQYCEAQLSEFAPSANVQARSPQTSYHLFVRLDGMDVPASSQLFNNHIPLDPRLDGAVAVTKTTPMLHVTRGQLVPYVITVSNSFGADLRDVNIIDRFPAGFHYVEGSARFDDVPTEPAIAGRELTWSNLLLQTDGRHEIKLLLAVGSGVTEGEFTNYALAMNALTGAAMSAEAAARVRIVPDPTFDCTDVTGKVFNDSNRNGYQDGDESGLPGVRLVTARGLAATTDSYGRYHITCAIVPNSDRGSNFILKLDDRTLPSGYRASTRPVQVQRATRGKALRMNFGASIHRVVGLDIADAVFEPGSVVMRQQWEPRIGMLLDELKTAPSTLRLSYVADLEPESLVEQRLNLLKDRIATAWKEIDCCYELVIEPEVHWRLGGPVKLQRGGDQ
jgi:uncharacterized repeat protein (TIGR01451 family)/fimbrial isopeptide formation D2 family protein